MTHFNRTQIDYNGNKFMLHENSGDCWIIIDRKDVLIPDYIKWKATRWIWFEDDAFIFVGIRDTVTRNPMFT